MLQLTMHENPISPLPKNQEMLTTVEKYFENMGRTGENSVQKLFW